MTPKTLTPAQAAQLFLRPRRQESATIEGPFEQAQQQILPFESGQLVIWSAGQGPTVLVLHGWEGTVADMSPVASALLRSGCRVVALEFPAHGRSDGDTTSLFQLIRAVNHTVKAIGPIDAVVAHSVGCAVAIEAMKASMKPKAAILIGTPARYQDYAWQFGRLVGLTDEGIQEMFAHLRQMDVDVSTLDSTQTVRSLSVPALIIHSDDDRVIPSAIAQEVANAWPEAIFKQVHGLGHNRILAAPDVIDAALCFIQKHVLQGAPLS